MVVAAETAVEKGWPWLWIETDSKSAMESFASGKIPWRLKGRWIRCANLLNIKLSHIWREGNMAADQAASIGKFLQPGQKILFDGKPDWITKWEVPYGEYRREKKKKKKVCNGHFVN